MKNIKKGFTLIELMVVISVIAILATISLFGFGKAQSSARDVSRAQIMNGIRTALERYYGDSATGYPASGFCAMVDALKTGLYLPATGPTDPKSKVSICAATTYSCDTAPICGATYAYTKDSPATGQYRLTLTKESGGIQNFDSPQ